jgi:hypothetical protein
MRLPSITTSRTLVGLTGSTALLALCLAACKPPAPPVDLSATSVEVEGPAIRQALHEFIDRTPGARPMDLEVAQVGVDSGYALVTWMHEKEAGQALLRKQAGVWIVVECGAGWLGLRGICKEQVPTDVAQRLLQQVDPKWGSYETP